MSGVARRSDSPAVTSKRSAKHPDVTELYGDGAMLDVCSRFYNKIFADPVMGVLFEDHSEPHAWRLAAFFVRQFGGDDEYSDVRGYGFRSLFVNHRKGMVCPARGKDCGTSFTVTHRERWLRYMGEACDEAGTSASFKRNVMAFANNAMRFYGPFWDDRAQVAELERRLRADEEQEERKRAAADDAEAKSSVVNSDVVRPRGVCPVAHHGHGTSAGRDRGHGSALRRTGSAIASGHGPTAHSLRVSGGAASSGRGGATSGPRPSSRLSPVTEAGSLHRATAAAPERSP